MALKFVALHPSSLPRGNNGDSSRDTVGTLQFVCLDFTDDFMPIDCDSLRNKANKIKENYNEKREKVPTEIEGKA